MATNKIDTVGSWIAIFVGLPLGIAFCFLVLYISLFPPLDVGLSLIGGGLFWFPIVWAGLIPLTYTFLLWTAGKRIKKHLNKNYSALKTSFLFTTFVNAYLFGLFFGIFIISVLFINPLQTSSYYNFVIAPIVIILIFLLATIFITFTIGLLIVSITKNKIYRESL